MKRLVGVLLLWVYSVGSAGAQETVKIGYPSTSYTTIPIVTAVR